MKKLEKPLLLIMTILLLAGCTQKTDTADTSAAETSVIKALETNESMEPAENNTKLYLLKTDAEEFIPQLILNDEEKTFSFSYDVLSSYLAVGTYTESNGQLELKTDDGKYHYIFDIIDENTLKFNLESSSDVNGGLGAEIADGAEFIIDSSDTPRNMES